MVKYKLRKVSGGSVDGAGTAENGYTARGGREIEEDFECFMELFSFIPISFLLKTFPSDS